MILFRSIVFNILFYLNTIAHLLATPPTFFMPRQGMMGIARSWARSSNWLLRVVVGLKVEWRGLEKIPKGALIVASKHQSTWETFALTILFPDFAIILKRELMWIPAFGWSMWKAGMIPIDRGKGSEALARMTGHARKAIADGRQIIIFPEGTRRPAGAEPAYKFGVARLYVDTGAPCLPIALNSGMFWPRRHFMRYPGTIVIEVLDPIPPGLDRQTFFQRLQTEIETATARLIEEGRRELAAHGITPPPAGAPSDARSPATG